MVRKTWEEFRGVVLDESDLKLRIRAPETRRRLAEFLKNEIFDLSGPRRRSTEGTKDQRYLSIVFQGVIEIDSCCETLDDILIYMRSFPYRAEQITKPRHLKYHIENFLNESYILKERMIAYSTKLGRAYRGDNRHQPISTGMREVAQMVEASMRNIVGVRGRHVHVERHSDSGLDRLETFDLLRRQDLLLDDDMLDIYQDTYIRTRREWRQRLAEARAGIQSVVDEYSNQIMRHLYNSNRKRLKYPRRSAT